MEMITESRASAIIKAPIKLIDVTQWLFSLKDEEYQACSVAHIACGSSFTSTGKRSSINVENVAGNLLIQHYVEDIGEAAHCRVHSITDSFSQMGRTKLGVTWELKIKALSEKHCELENRVSIFFTADFLAILKNAGIIDFTPVKNEMAQHVADHNLEETPLFALDMEHKALSGTWAES